MKVLILTLFVASFAQAAESLNFTYFGNEGRNRIYLSCDYAERATEDILVQMGAENIDVRCNGGLDFGYYTPVSINAKFDFATTGTVAIESDFNTNCYFDTALVNRMVRKFDNISKVSANSFCFSSDDNYSFELDVQ
jgi:hypothetical protein